MTVQLYDSSRYLWCRALTLSFLYNVERKRVVRVYDSFFVQVQCYNAH